MHEPTNIVLPLLIIYEGGVLLLGPSSVRNGADVWLRNLLDLFGLGGYFALPEGPVLLIDKPGVESTLNSLFGDLRSLERELERAKIASLTEAITEAFGEAPLVFKAGRYGFGSNTREHLIAANMDPVTEIDRWFTQLRSIWDMRLEALDDALTKESPDE